MPLSEPILTVLREFESAFSQPTGNHILVLIAGTILARGRRTVSTSGVRWIVLALVVTPPWSEPAAQLQRAAQSQVLAQCRDTPDGEDIAKRVRRLIDLREDGQFGDGIEPGRPPAARQVKQGRTAAAAISGAAICARNWAD